MITSFIETVVRKAGFVVGYVQGLFEPLDHYEDFGQVSNEVRSELKYFWAMDLPVEYALEAFASWGWEPVSVQAAQAVYDALDAECFIYIEESNHKEIK